MFAETRGLGLRTTANAVVALLGEEVRRVVGSLETEIWYAAPLGAAEHGAIAFCTAPGESGTALISASRASVVLCAYAGAPEGDFDSRTLILVDAPRLAFIRVVAALFSPPPPRGIHSSAIIDPEARIAGDVYVGPGAYIGQCSIGSGSVIHGRVYVYSGTRIGSNVIIHAGSVIGADGFGYQRDEQGTFVKFPHLGGVTIEDDVEIGANACIDRGTLSDTLIREGAKIDNLVHIAHNVVVGRHTAVIAHAMIGGSTKIGDYAWVAPSACIRDGLTLGDRSIVGLGAVVVKDVLPGQTVMGVPAREEADYKVLLSRFRQLAKPD